MSNRAINKNVYVKKDKEDMDGKKYINHSE